MKLLTHLFFTNDFFDRIYGCPSPLAMISNSVLVVLQAIGVDVHVIGHRMGQQGGEECRDCCYKSAATVAATAGYLTITRANTEGTLSLLRLPGVFPSSGVAGMDLNIILPLCRVQYVLLL